MHLCDLVAKVFVDDELDIAFEHFHGESDSPARRVFGDDLAKDLILQCMTHRIVVLLAKKNDVICCRGVDNVCDGSRFSLTVEDPIQFGVRRCLSHAGANNNADNSEQ